MIDNNLCFDIALYPYELVTYGETGQVCQNWMQYRLIKQYLEELTQEQTLVIESGHPLGLFRSRPDAPRKLSYKEQRELEQLEKDIESLTAEKSDLESKMNGGLTDPAELQKVTTRFAEVSSELDTKETRWLELSV